MKTIIAGSRGIDDYEMLLTAIDLSKFKITEVVSGNARGVDRLGESWARRHKIPIKIFKPDWDTYQRSAGIRRNVEMAKYAEALIALWDGKSKGTWHMIRTAKSLNLKVFVYKP